MPIYEYRCHDCGTTFSRLQRVGAGADGVRCPSCESEKIERLLSSFASGTSSTSAGASPTAHSCPSGFS